MNRPNPLSAPRAATARSRRSSARRIVLATLLMPWVSFAWADLEIRFVESAPKDRFEFENTGTCALADATVRLDLSTSVGRLIFDTGAGGAGVEVYQPLEIVSGDIGPAPDEIGVADGDAGLALRIANLAPAEVAVVTIDVDDSLPDGELGMIRVSGAEIASGRVELEMDGIAPIAAAFGPDAKATLSFDSCTSP